MGKIAGCGSRLRMINSVVLNQEQYLEWINSVYVYSEGIFFWIQFLRLGSPWGGKVGKRLLVKGTAGSSARKTFGQSLMSQSLFFIHKIVIPAGPVVRNPPCNAGDMGLILGQGPLIQQAVERISPHSTTTESVHRNQRVRAPQRSILSEAR